jgi:hypothetical protein
MPRPRRGACQHAARQSAAQEPKTSKYLRGPGIAELRSFVPRMAERRRCLSKIFAPSIFQTALQAGTSVPMPKNVMKSSGWGSWTLLELSALIRKKKFGRSLRKSERKAPPIHDTGPPIEAKDDVLPLQEERRDSPELTVVIPGGQPRASLGTDVRRPRPS